MHQLNISFRLLYFYDFYSHYFCCSFVQYPPVLQVIGVPVTGLEPEFQPVINHLLPHITSHKQDPEDIHLQVETCFDIFLSGYAFFFI